MIAIFIYKTDIGRRKALFFLEAISNGKFSLAVVHKFDNSQRFNAGFGNEVKVESREGLKKRAIVPMGLNKEKRIMPSVKTLVIGEFGQPEYQYRPARSSNGCHQDGLSMYH
jgi:hypothetical protein